MRNHSNISLFAVVLTTGIICSAETVHCEEPTKVSVCQLKDNPPNFNHQLVEVTGFVSHGFEDFRVFDPTCESYPYIWLEYGGLVKSGTMYCCGVSADRSRAKELKVEEIRVPLVDDEKFKAFDNLIQLRPSSLVHATVVGRFFAGKEIKAPKSAFWGGYGHMGCCSLLAIQRVLSVDPHDRPDLDYGATVEPPEFGNVGCGYRILVPPSSLGSAASIEAEKKAELAQAESTFEDPQRVASEALAQFVKIDPTMVAGMKQAGAAQGRIIYEWNLTQNKLSYMVVVSRPYLVSFYAKDPRKIAWIVVGTYESSCDKNNPAKRIRKVKPDSASSLRPD